MKNGVDAKLCGGRNDDDEDPIEGESRWSNGVDREPLPPRHKMSPDWLVWWWSLIEESWGPTWDKPKAMLLVLAYKWLPMALKLGWCLALSWASASQKALWVIKLSRLQQLLAKEETIRSPLIDIIKRTQYIKKEKWKQNLNHKLAVYKMSFGYTATTSNYRFFWWLHVDRKTESLWKCIWHKKQWHISRYHKNSN